LVNTGEELAEEIIKKDADRKCCYASREGEIKKKLKGTFDEVRRVSPAGKMPALPGEAPLYDRYEPLRYAHFEGVEFVSASKEGLVSFVKEFDSPCKSLIYQYSGGGCSLYTWKDFEFVIVS